MKKIVLFILASLMAGCATGPSYILVKNCKDLGYSLYRCEEMPKNKGERR